MPKKPRLGVSPAGGSECFRAAQGGTGSAELHSAEDGGTTAGNDLRQRGAETRVDKAKEHSAAGDGQRHPQVHAGQGKPRVGNQTTQREHLVTQSLNATAREDEGRHPEHDEETTVRQTQSWCSGHARKQALISDAGQYFSQNDLQDTEESEDTQSAEPVIDWRY